MGEILWEPRDVIRPRGWGLVNSDYQARKEVQLFLFRNRVHIPLFFPPLELHVAMGTGMALGAHSHSPA